jgi:hypothetical protein
MGCPSWTGLALDCGVECSEDEPEGVGDVESASVEVGDEGERVLLACGGGDEVGGSRPLI